jgi:UDP-N-acetylglucosamine 2-epimerase (non-hydrolysing)
MRRVAVIFGTRPEAIKLAPLVLALRRAPDLDCHVCVTAQHRQMLDDVLGVFGITPETDLDLMREAQTLGGFTSRAMAALDGFLAAERPDLLLIQGDTTTVFCAALAAFYHRIPVGHVEAGLRTGNVVAPWPEEMNRLLTARLAGLHFAPTETGRRNLLAEGVPAEHVHVTGNTVVDALLLARERVRRQAPEVPGLAAEILAPGGPPLVLLTSHRREHFGGALERILTAVARLARRYPETAFVYPVHRNPEVRRAADAILRSPDPATGNVHLIEPTPYLAFVALMERSTLILTDSGGIQEEAPSLGVPVLVLRESTERPEAVDAGCARLVGTDSDDIEAAAVRLLEDPAARESMAQARNPFGDGRASERILAVLRSQPIPADR